MSIRKTILAAGGLALAAALGLGAGAAQASSTGCAFSNGCATLHGTNALGEAVAMDAKYQNKTEIVIGYPDNAGDGATSFDGVLHYTRATSVKTWDDTEVLPVTVPDVTQTGTSPIHVTHPTADASTGTWGFRVSGGSAPYTVTVSGLPGATVTSPVSAPSTSNPAADNAVFQVNGATNAPGLYDNVTLTITDSATPAANTFSATIAVRVLAHQVTIPGGDKPFYTLVYAPKGDWTSQCVTDINGSGALKLYPCTAGHDPGQDFTADSTSGLLGATQAHVSNLLAASVGASSCLTDPSVSNPATPQSDAADQVPTGGRQMYVNGSCASGANLWTWGT